MPYVTSPCIHFLDELNPAKDKRWALLFLRQVSSAKVRTLSELDHWVGECDWSSRSCLFYRLHLVWPIPYLDRPILEFTMVSVRR
jgi:hypothetical protein